MSAPSPPAPALAGRGVIESLTGIRALACLIVVLVHLAPWAIALEPVTAGFLRPLWHQGYIALDLFFVLSGFVISAGYQRAFAQWPSRGTYGRFLWARLSRFYPVHLAVLVALVAAVLGGRAVGVDIPHGGTLTWDLLRQVTLTSGWGGARALTWNGPAWSLSAEWLCYLVLPLISPCIARLRRPGAAVAVFLVASLLPIAVYSVIGLDDGTMTYSMPLPRAFGGFISGASLYQLTRVDSRLPALVGRVTGPLITVAVAACVVLALTGIPTLLALPLVALIVLALSQQHGAVDAWLSTRSLMFAGEISVAVFLTHYPWLLLASRVATPQHFPGAWGWLAIVGMLLGALVIGWLTWRMIERPSQRWMRRMVKRVPTAPAKPIEEVVLAEVNQAPTPS